MLGFHRQASRPTAAPGIELGRVDWLVLSSAALVLGAAAHAVSGVVGIAKEMVQTAPQGALTSHHAGATVNERDGWILISLLFVITAAVGHGAARIVESVRGVVHPAHPEVRA